MQIETVQYIGVRDEQLDKEWAILILQAHMMGLTIEQVQNGLKIACED